MAHTVVMADDVTGANDIGIMYAKAELDTLVYSFGDGSPQDYEDCDVLVVDTDSRFDTKEEAYRKVSLALSRIPKDGVKQYIDKQCSVFRGNIGPEFDAMLDALDENFAVVVLGFPDNGRTTVNSLHYVYGKLLEESQFRTDPVHPMTCSDLREILGNQTNRPVGAIHHAVYDEGEDAVRTALSEARTRGGYCIMDVRNNQDLEFLAGILKEETIICGSSALSAYLAKVQNFPGADKKEPDYPIPGKEVFCIAGSLTPQTVGQTAYMKEKGYPVFELDTRKLLEKSAREEECRRVREAARNAYERSSFAMIHSMNHPELVEKTKRLAREAGIDNKQVSAMVSSALAEIAEWVSVQCGIRNIIVCGGDTSAALCTRLGVFGMRVLEEIETGLPTCQSVNAPFYQLVLKSGSFGSPEFIEKAIGKLTGGKNDASYITSR